LWILTSRRLDWYEITVEMRGMRSAGLTPMPIGSMRSIAVGKFADFYFQTGQRLALLPSLVCANTFFPQQSTEQGEIWFIY